MARSMAKAFDVVLIDRVDSAAARASAPTWSTPGRPCRKRRSAASERPTSVSDAGVERAARRRIGSPFDPRLVRHRQGRSRRAGAACERPPRISGCPGAGRVPPPAPAAWTAIGAPCSRKAPAMAPAADPRTPAQQRMHVPDERLTSLILDYVSQPAVDARDPARPPRSRRPRSTRSSTGSSPARAWTRRGSSRSTPTT